MKADKTSGGWIEHCFDHIVTARVSQDQNSNTWHHCWSISSCHHIAQHVDVEHYDGCKYMKVKMTSGGMDWALFEPKRPPA